MSADIGLFKQGMRQLSAGVCLITTRCKDERGGLTATAVCSVSAQPPQLLVCVNKTASAHDLIMESGIFCVNVLATQHIDLAARFSGQHGIEGDERFQDREWPTLKTGSPVLPGALVSFDCAVVRRVDAGTHTIFIGGIEDVAVSDGKPLIYSNGDFMAPLHSVKNIA